MNRIDKALKQSHEVDRLKRRHDHEVEKLKTMLKQMNMMERQGFLESKAKEAVANVL